VKLTFRKNTARILFPVSLSFLLLARESVGRVPETRRAWKSGLRDCSDDCSDELTEAESQLVRARRGSRGQEPSEPTGEFRRGFG